MSILIVTAHPDTDSLTHHAATRLQATIEQDQVQIAHLAQEGFDPRFTLPDRKLYLGEGSPDADILAEQDRLDRVSDLVLIFPVYWWSLPGLLKGWFDRVFIAGWAFDFDDSGHLLPKLGGLTVHVLATAGTTAESFARHGYTESFTTQIERGIFDFCGMRRGHTEFIHDSESTDQAATATALTTATTRMAQALQPAPQDS